MVAVLGLNWPAPEVVSMQQYLSWIENLPRGVLIGLAVVAVMLFFWVWANYGRRHYLVIKKSDATHLIIYELGRIADSLERLENVVPRRRQERPTLAPEQHSASLERERSPVAPQESSPFVPQNPEAERRIGLSMFGR
jgi:hypothetical protein